MNVLFVANYPRNTGYAWNTISEVFRRLGARLVEAGHRVRTSYAPDTAPQSTHDTDTLQVDYLAVPQSARALKDFLALLRTQRVDALYLTDQPTWSPLYLLYRVCGVKRIIVHDRTSGVRSPRAASRALKRLVQRTPGVAADCVIGVSDFVVQRLIDINGAPRSRVFRVHNGIDLARFENLDRGYIRRELGLADDVPIIFFAGRANRYKGIAELIEAVRLLEQQQRAVAIVICGQGPDLPELRHLSTQLGLRRAYFLGKRDDVPALLAGATISVVPSLWAEAFGLTVVEAMAAGVPVVATRTGGIPELVDHDRTGVLIRPGDAAAIATACAQLLDNPERARRIACAGRQHAVEYFGIDRTVSELAAILQRVLR